MTDNNGIPFEVKKPFETVYELKNEVPSFEEFMKTYEADESLNYDDLSYSDISDKGKGYGPCSPSYCSGCSCPRSDCNCNSGERFVKVLMSCPSVKDGIRCPGGNRAPTNWVHATDSNYIWISNQARIRCEKSYCSATNHMKDWAFMCSDYSFHKGKYIGANSDSWIKVVTTVGGMLGDDDLVADLLIYLKTHKW